MIFILGTADQSLEDLMKTLTNKLDKDDFTGQGQGDYIMTLDEFQLDIGTVKSIGHSADQCSLLSVLTTTGDKRESDDNVRTEIDSKGSNKTLMESSRPKPKGMKL